MPQTVVVRPQLLQGRPSDNMEGLFQGPTWLRAQLVLSSLRAP